MKREVFMKFLICTLFAVLPLTCFSSEVLTTEAREVQDVVLNPETLRVNLIEGGLPILAAANRVHKAKDSVNLARTRLLPSLNLGVLAASLANPTFILSSVEYVLPFLIPSKWFDAAKAKQLAEAEKIAFLLTELNIYSSLYSLYYTLNLDLQTREFLSFDFRDTILIEQIVERAYEDGRATEADLNLARSQTANAKVRLNRFNELLIDEIAILRQVLGLPMEARISFEMHDITPSELESLPLPSAIKIALEKAPEARQIKHLLEAAKYERWSKYFGFITGAGAGSSASGMGESASLAFSDQGGRGMFNFGFDYFPNISLSNRNLEEIKIREAELSSEISKLIESMQGRFDFVESRFLESRKSEGLLRRVFENDQKRYSSGDIPLSTLVESMSRLRQAGLERLRSQTDLQLLRVSMHRVLVTDQFANFKGCEALPKTEKKKSGWRWPWESDDDEDPICDPESVKKRFVGAEEPESEAVVGDGRPDDFGGNDFGGE